MKHFIAGGLTCIASLILSGCGGAGNSPTSATPAPTENLRITKANALATARATNDFFDLFELTEFVDEFIEYRNSTWYGTGTERQCITGDATSGTWQLTAPGVGATPQAGDSITVTYKNCLQDPAIPDRLSGTLAIKLTSVTGNPTKFAVRTPWSYKADVTFTKLDIKNLHRHHTIDGSMSIEVGTRGLATKAHYDVNDLKITAARIHIQKDADSHEFTNVNMSIVQDNTFAVPTFQAMVNGSIESTALGGKIDVQTINALTGSGNTEYASGGYARLTGGYGTSIEFRPGASTGQANVSGSVENRVYPNSTVTVSGNPGIDLRIITNRQESRTTNKEPETTNKEPETTNKEPETTNQEVETINTTWDEVDYD